MNGLEALFGLGIATIVGASCITISLIVGRAATLRPRLEHRVDMAKAQILADLNAQEIEERRARLLDSSLEQARRPQMLAEQTQDMGEYFPPVSNPNERYLHPPQTPMSEQ